MDGTFWLEEYSGTPVTPASLKRKVKSKKVEFVGWGSKPLIEFLESIGKDPTEKISQRDVSEIINKYIDDKDLVHRTKKKRVVCDERLYSIFGKKEIGRNKVNDLLETHYAENQDSSDDDALFNSEEENPGQEQKGLSLEKKTYQKKKVFETPKNGFAAIIRENIELVYLKKSLVLYLSKDFESFETKVVDSFVRIKSDSNYFPKKNSHQLVLVKGMKVSENNDINTGVILQVSNFAKDVRISMLSDDDFSQEECEDLHQRMKRGLLKRPTVAELEAKARILHEDKTKHWLAAELTLLPKLINRAYEQGRRGESLTMFNYMDRKELLQTPEEQSRLLHEVPNVIAEEVEPKTAPENAKRENDSSQIPTVRGASEVPTYPTSNGKLSTLMPLEISSGTETAPENAKCENDSSQIPTVRGATEIPTYPTSNGKLSMPLEISSAAQSSEVVSKDFPAAQSSKVISKIPVAQPSKVISEYIPVVQPFEVISKDIPVAQPSEVISKEIPAFRDVREQLILRREIHVESAQIVNVPKESDAVVEHNFLKVLDTPQVIDLSDDDDDDDVQVVKVENDVGSLMWHYEDPQGVIRGPFSLTSLKIWLEADYFPDDFKVWKTGQNRNTAVLLADVIGRLF